MAGDKFTGNMVTQNPSSLNPVIAGNTPGAWITESVNAALEHEGEQGDKLSAEKKIMSRLVKSLLVGLAFFALAFSLVLAIVFVRSVLSGLNFDLTYTVKNSLKSGLGAGITMMILFIVGAPRPRNPH